MSDANERAQEPFLNGLRKRRAVVELYLVSGVRLVGTIESFDPYSLRLRVGNEVHLVLKNRVSAVVPSKRRATRPARERVRVERPRQERQAVEGSEPPPTSPAPRRPVTVTYRQAPRSRTSSSG